MGLTELIQKICQANIEAQKLTDIATGTVTQVSPLKISISVELPPIGEEALILTENVKEWQEDVQIAYNGGTPQNATIYHKGLKTGDKVVMMRVSKGQRFIVLSRI